jgi:universal stress protein A
MFPPKKILVPTDFSTFSDVALKQAIEIAKQFKSKIYLFHVTPIIKQWPTGYALDLDTETIENVEKQSVKYSDDMMSDQIEKVAKKDDVVIITTTKEGVAYDEILKEQKAKKFDLVVIASHGRTGMMSHLMGSVALKVAQHASCPVLLVRGK